LQCDAYAAYESFARKRTGAPITLAGCWAHTRRGFFEAREQAPQQTFFILRQIRHLYRIEAKLRRQKAGPALRLARRTSESRAIYRRLYKVLWSTTIILSLQRQLKRPSLDSCRCVSGGGLC
jgi:hypothetical protein